MIARYREYEPCAALARCVRALFTFSINPKELVPRRRVTRDFTFGDGDPFWSTTFADGHVSIVANGGDEYRIDGLWEPRQARPHVIGPMSRFRVSRYGAGLVQVGAFLKPGGAWAFTGVSGTELVDRVVGLDDLWGAEAAEFGERFSEAGSDEERVASLEAALLSRMGTAGATSYNASRVAEAIAARQGQVRIEELANAAGVSRQHLTRTFRESVGVSPKLYARLARFQHALHVALRGGIDWAQMAVDLGYTDQSHLITDFRTFTGLTPDRFVRERCFHPFA